MYKNQVLAFRILNAYSRRYEIKLSFKSISQYEKIKI